MKKLLSLLLAAALVLGLPAGALAAVETPDYTDLVTDAFTYEYTDEFGNPGSFYVPKINLDGEGIQAVNDTIWQNLYEDMLAGENGSINAVENGGMPAPYLMSYQWAVNGDVLSLLTVAYYNDDRCGYIIYNVSLSAGRRIADSELLSVVGLSQEEFYAMAGQVLSDTFEKNCSSFPEDEVKARQRASNNADENIRAAQPYLNANGDLCMTATVYAMVAAGRYDQELTVLARDQLPDQSFGSAGLPEQLPAAETPVEAAPAVETPDYTDLVTDAFSYEYTNGWGDPRGYHVPKIGWDGAGIQALNDAIWQQYYENILAREGGSLAALRVNDSPDVSSMWYDWAVNGDVLSLLIICSYSWEYDTFETYNVSLSTGRRITDQELLGLLGIQEDAFYAQAAQALSAAFEEWNSMFLADASVSQELDRARAQNNADSNVRAVRPYLDADGSLCATCKIYTLAGGGEHNSTLTVLPREQLPETISSAGLPEQAPADGRLMYFIDHCDSVYFTRADIEGFDDRMCLYARNSIYAKLGWKFSMPELQAFFSQFGWYSPTLDPSAFTADMLNSFQQANVDLVLNYEAEMGY